MELLASKMNPKTLDDVIGQRHLLGKNKVFTNLVKNKKIFSMILYGPPGIGKTSIARAMVNDLGMHFRFLNATINNKKDLDQVIEEAKLYDDGLILIMDEIHRLNKDKQDILLPQLETGLITLIGMTTSNPYHSINPAIRSRCQLYELKPLTKEDIIDGLDKACKSGNLPKIKIDKDSIEYIASCAGSDLRFAYNLLEVAYYSYNGKITLEDLKKLNNKPSYVSDKDGDGHYDLLSAFQKSIRGSDVDAALHYLGRLIEFGDLDSIYRRMSVICYEDIGLANPSMGPRVMAAISASELIGLPEARIPLGEIVIELALSPKSNSAISAIDAALEDIEKGNIGPIPDVIKINTTTYKYPHNYPGAYVVQQYMPDNLLNKKYYTPKEYGYEVNIKKVYDNIEKIKKRSN